MVGLGGSIGAMLRYLVAGFINTTSFPLNTLVINIVGCLVIGIMLALGEKPNVLSNDLKLFLATGICGGFTTFSTFSAENFLLIKSGDYLTAALYIFTSITVCIIATFIGFKIINN